VLIGHGYGGLVIKNLISQTYNHVGKEDDIKQRDKEWRKAYNFLQKLRGIVFFSVPHSTVEGTREFEHYIMESSKSRVLRRSGLLKWLKNDMEAFSRQMKQLSVDFETRVPKRTVILSFVEGKGKVSKLLPEYCCFCISSLVFLQASVLVYTTGIVCYYHWFSSTRYF
jgi:hypothetical protein